MNKISPQLKELLQAFRKARLERNIDSADIESELILGPGWLEDIENGKVSISLEMFFAILKTTKISLSELSINLKAGGFKFEAQRLVILLPPTSHDEACANLNISVAAYSSAQQRIQHLLR